MPSEPQGRARALGAFEATSPSRGRRRTETAKVWDSRTAPPAPGTLPYSSARELDLPIGQLIRAARHELKMGQLRRHAKIPL